MTYPLGEGAKREYSMGLPDCSRCLFARSRVNINSSAIPQLLVVREIRSIDRELPFVISRPYGVQMGCWYRRGLAMPPAGWLGGLRGFWEPGGCQYWLSVGTRQAEEGLCGGARGEAGVAYKAILT